MHHAKREADSALVHSSRVGTKAILRMRSDVISSGSGQSGSTSRTLLERIKLRDPAAWRRFTELYGPIVYHWSEVAGLQATDAADVTQEVFRSVMTGVGEFRHERPGDSFRGWLFTITRNKLRDFFRSQAKPGQAIGGTEGQRQLEQAAEVSQTDIYSPPPGASDLTRRALQIMQTDFEPATWQAFWKTAVEGQSPADVARELGLTLAAVYKAKSRVLNHLRRELDGLVE